MPRCARVAEVPEVQIVEAHLSFAPAGCESVSLFDNDFVLAVAMRHPLAARAGRISMDELAQHRSVAVGDTTRHLPNQPYSLRRAARMAPPPRRQRGYSWMLDRHILQADQGGDFDPLETSFGAAVPEPDIF